MTRKHFEQIARLINTRRAAAVLNSQTYAEATLRSLAEELGVYFLQTNKSFDEARFMAACGYGVERAGVK